MRGGTWTHSLGQDGAVALAAFGAADGSSFTAEFDSVRLFSLKEAPNRGR